MPGFWHGAAKDHLLLDTPDCQSERGETLMIADFSRGL